MTAKSGRLRAKKNKEAGRRRTGQGDEGEESRVAGSGSTGGYNWRRSAAKDEKADCSLQRVALRMLLTGRVAAWEVLGVGAVPWRATAW